MSVREELKYFVPGMLRQYLVNTLIIYLFICISVGIVDGSYERLHAATLDLVAKTAIALSAEATSTGR